MDDRHDITDDYSDQISFNSILLISQYCAFKNNYKKINIINLEKIINESSDNLFSYSVISSEFTIDEKTKETATYYHYTVEYAGDSYFAEIIFHLSNKQLTTSEVISQDLDIVTLTFREEQGLMSALPGFGLLIFMVNIGVIPDLTKKISTIRSRGLSISCIFQNLPQMQNRYPLDQWQEIDGNCDTQLFLGCTDEIAEYIRIIK